MAISTAQVCLVRWRHVWLFRAWEKWLDSESEDDQFDGKGYLGSLMSSQGAMDTVDERDELPRSHLRSRRESYVDDDGEDLDTFVNAGRRSILNTGGRTLAEEVAVAELSGENFMKLRNNFESETKTQTWSSLRFHEVMKIVNDNSLNVKTEMAVLEAIIRWVEHDQQARLTGAVDDLLGNVRWDLMSVLELEQSEKKPLLCHQSILPTMNKYWKNAYRHHALPSDRKRLYSTLQSTPRIPVEGKIQEDRWHG